MDRTKINECFSCKHRREVLGNCHILCAKPDPEMSGKPHGIRNGWFMYPWLFDPTWKVSSCTTYEEGKGGQIASIEERADALFLLPIYLR